MEELNPLEKVTVATWNILHTEQDEYEKRLDEVAANLDDVDVLLIQEALITENINMVTDLADRLEMHIAATGNTKTYHAEANKSVSGIAILSKLPIIESENIMLDNGYVEEAASAWIRMPSGREMLAICSHLEWGGPRTFARAKQAQQINDYVDIELKNKPYRSADAPVVVWGGDFNATPESLPIQYITGNAAVDNRGAFWVDAWATSGDGSEGYTNDPMSYWAEETARNAGIIHPQYVPKRRIDYIFVKDWAYGRPGYPFKTEVRGAESIYGEMVGSDHYAVVSHIWDPPTDVFIRPIPQIVRENLKK